MGIALSIGLESEMALLGFIQRGHHFFKARTALSCLVASLCILPAIGFAGGSEQLLFLPDGSRATTTNFSTSETFKVVLPNLCGTATRACFPWKIITSTGIPATTYKTKIDDAFRLWTNITTLDVEFRYAGAGNDFSLPYQMTGVPPQREKDAFNNEILAGDFYIAIPETTSGIPAEILPFGPSEYLKSKIYYVPNLAQKTVEVRWAGIYVNPAYRNSDAVRLTTILAAEVGRIMGLASSGIPSSLLYVFRENQILFSDLSIEDEFWASSKYPMPNFQSAKGKISGRLIDGRDGSGWMGGQISLLPFNRVGDFVNSINRRALTVLGATTSKNGDFQFDAVDPGEYILIAEPLNFSPFNYILFDEATRFFGRSEIFDIEFYDGKGREGNHEAVLSYSPSSIEYAAKIVVVAGAETKDVEIITNQADEGLAPIVAKGSTNEMLSDILPAEAINYEAPEGQSGGDGGCALRSVSDADYSTFEFGWILTILFSVVFLRLLRLQDRRVK